MANLIENELCHGYELARQLEAQLSSAPVELWLLAHELVACLEKSKSMVKSTVGGPGSPCMSFIEDSEQPFRAEKNTISISKKRKTQLKRTNQVKLGTGPESVGPLDDGYSWRKYGQKQILGVKNPRGYYRCTHRDTRGCLATRQVQKSDNNPLIFEVTYRGAHTCLQESPLQNDDRKKNRQLLLGFQDNLRVETADLDLKFQEPASSFSFPPTPIDNRFESGFNAAFISPTTSESNHFSAFPCGMSSHGGPGIQASESDFAGIMSSVSTEFDDEFLIEYDADFQYDPFDCCLSVGLN